MRRDFQSVNKNNTNPDEKSIPPCDFLPVRQSPYSRDLQEICLLLLHQAWLSSPVYRAILKSLEATVNLWKHPIQYGLD